MNEREAILRTAELFEREPEVFNFNVTRVPECGSPGCVLGFIGRFLGVRPGKYLRHVEEWIGTTETEFYDRMRRICRENFDPMPFMGWTINAHIAASCLRLYADRHHPAHALGSWHALREVYQPLAETEEQTCT